MAERPKKEIPNIFLNSRPVTRFDSVSDTTKSSQLRSSEGHTVLCVDEGVLGRSSSHPAISLSMMNSEKKFQMKHVRMPWSHGNDLFEGQEEAEKRWRLVQRSLGGCKFKSFEDLRDTILLYNSQYAPKWNFDGLREYMQNTLSKKEREVFLKNTLPKLARLALQLPSLLKEPIPLLRKGVRHTITMNQQQAACLLANAFFCTFPPRNRLQSEAKGNTFMDINFSRLFSLTETAPAKLNCIFHYFSRVLSKMPNGAISFERRCLTKCVNWSRSNTKFTRLQTRSNGTVEDAGEKTLQVDFSNKFVGSGVFLARCVQEEIKFLICPEMIVSRLFVEELDDNECLVMTGCERYSHYTGYGHTFQWSRPYTDNSARDEWNRRKSQVVAIDAKPYKFLEYPYGLQFSKQEINRELNKAYCGLYPYDMDTPGQHRPVATGDWGCGGHGGDRELKSIMQYMAASECGRNVIYFTSGDASFAEALKHMAKLFIENELTVGQVYNMISNYNGKYAKPSLTVSSKPTTSLFDFILSSCSERMEKSNSSCIIC